MTYGGGHVTMAVPLIHEMRRRSSWDITVLGLTTAGAVLRAAGIPHRTFRDLLRPSDHRAVEVGQRLAEDHHMPGAGIDRDESVAYLGLSYADLEERLGAAEAVRRFAAHGRRAFLPLGPLERLMDDVSPEMVVATSAPRAEEAAIRVARARGIPSVCVNDLFGLDEQNSYLYEPGYGDAVTVVSEYARDVLVDHGRPADEIHVTGNPAFDRLADPDFPARGEQWRASHGVGERPLVLWASQPEPADPTLPDRVRGSIVAAAARNDWYVLHRPHPSEAQPDPIGWEASHVGREDELPVVLAACDVVVVLTTTVGLEAALVGKPVVKVRLSSYDSTMPYERMGFALDVPELGPLEAEIARALTDQESRAAMATARSRLPVAGGAASRVADVLERYA